MNTVERAKKAAAARWRGDRAESARISVDRDVAEDLKSIKPKSLARKIASEAIRDVLDRRGNSN